MEAIYVYDQVCQMVAAQPAARRGKLFDRFGRPMTVEDLAWELRREPAWTQEVIDVLLMAGWLRWMDPLRRLPGAWTGRQLGAAGAVSGADGAPTGRRRGAGGATLGASGATEQGHKDKLRNREEGIKTKTGADGLSECAPPEMVVGGPVGQEAAVGGEALRARLRLIFGEHSSRPAQLLDQHPQLTLLRLAQAVERAEIMRRHGRLRSGVQGYIVGDLGGGPYDLPADLKHLARLNGNGGGEGDVGMFLEPPMPDSLEKP